MGEFSGQLRETDAFEVFRLLATTRRTGVLDFASAGNEKRERFYFVGGELFLAPGHPLVPASDDAEQAGTQAVSSPGASDRARGLDRRWLEKCVARLSTWEKGSYRFIDDTPGIPSDLAGPFPTLSIVMNAAVAGREEIELLRILGGEEGRFVVAPRSQTPPPELLQLDPKEAFLLSRFEQGASVSDVLAQASIGRQEVLRQMSGLLVVGLLRREEGRAVSEGALLNPETFASFSDRILKSLERKPVDLDAEEHRRRIGELLESLDSLTHYQLLGVGGGASVEEVHDAYTRIARLVHPSHSASLGLSGRESAIRLLFEKATEAYLTLSDGERSREYRAKVGPSGFLLPAAESRERRGEIERMAEQHYRQARAFIARQEYHFAVELLNQAVRVDPRPEYYALLGRCQLQNPSWLSKAVANLEQALSLSPGDVDARLDLGRALEELGQLERAEEEYREVLSLSPGNGRASNGLARLSAAGSGVSGASLRGWVERLLRRARQIAVAVRRGR